MTVWISIEGLNGVGKTHLARQLAARLGDTCHLVGEVTDAPAHQLTGQVITALASGGDTFLRGGFPLTETLALLALKVLEHERLVDDPAPLVVEDRGVDTVAVYQAAICAPDAVPPIAMALVRQILAEAAVWRPPPAATLLLVDDIDTCVRRFGARLQRRVRPDEHQLLHRAHALYTLLAAEHPDRIHVIDRAGRPAAAVVEDMAARCQDLLHGGTPR